MKYLLTSIFILLFPLIASCMNQESDPSEKELVKIDDLEKQENRKLEKQENITRKDIPEINKITNKSDSGITSEQSTNKNSPSKKKLSKETTITTPAPTLTVIPTPVPIPIPIPIPAPTLTFIPPPTAIPTPTVIPTPIPPRNPKLVNTKKFKLIPTHTPTATATPYPEIRIIFGTTIIGIVNEWSLLRGGFVERQKALLGKQK